MQSFFKPGDFACPIYCRTRDKTDENNTAGRAFIEALWRECAAFLDPDTLQRATLNLPTVFWELYLAHTLLGSGISLQPQARTKQNKKGPDLFAANPDVWIEAVMPDTGTGADAMEHPPLGVAYNAPVDSFILRLQTAFVAKARKITNYMEVGPVRPGQAVVIAISSAMLPTSTGEGPIPRIVKAMLAVGSPVLHLIPSTGQIVDRSLEHRDEIQKQSGTVIRTDSFLNLAYAHISAVLCCASNWVTHAETPGRDFTIVYNENDTVKLPHGWLPAANEYWREGDALRSRPKPKA